MYIQTIQNTADIGSRGSNVENLPKEFWDGPRWLAYPDDWPKQNEITPTKESGKKAKMIKEVMCLATKKSEEIYQLLKILNFGHLLGKHPESMDFLKISSVKWICQVQ